MTTQTDNAHAWQRMIFVFLGLTAAGAALIYIFVLLLDPYGIRTTAKSAPTPIMDLNQRFMYPQIIRSHRYHAAIFGTSTMRLIDPQRLNALMAKPDHATLFANLGLNAGTPWEQNELAKLFLHHVPAPSALIWGLDLNWCESDATQDSKKLTPRPFPPWLYDNNPFNDYAEIFDLKSVEIAGRVALNHLGLMPERIRGDGYEVFTPPEALYDLNRARGHIWGQATPRPLAPQVPTITLSDQEQADLHFPALEWLNATLQKVPASSNIILIFPPIHVASQPLAGSAAAARDEACKKRIRMLTGLYKAKIIDFRFASPLTSRDENYWDPLHYRLSIAGYVTRVLAGLEAEGESFKVDP
jgi:hypothetical protein